MRLDSDSRIGSPSRTAHGADKRLMFCDTIPTLALDLVNTLSLIGEESSAGSGRGIEGTAGSRSRGVEVGSKRVMRLVSRSLRFGGGLAIAYAGRGMLLADSVGLSDWFRSKR